MHAARLREAQPLRWRLGCRWKLPRIWQLQTGGGVCACVCEVGVRVRVGKWCRETVASGGLCPPELLSMVGVDTNTEGNEASAMHAGVRAVTCSYVVSRLHAMYK